MRPAFALRQRASEQLFSPLPAAGAAARRLTRPLLIALLFALLAALGAGAGRALAQESAIHVVARGEKLALIAARYGVTLQEMVTANNLSDPNHIWVGQQLVVPGALASYAPASSQGGTYTVQRGDTLSQIAQRFGMDPAALMALNGMGDADFVWVGQQLSLGGGTGGLVEYSSIGSGYGQTYVVQPGDTLSQIARNFGVSMQDLLAINGLPNANFVWVGQQLAVAGQAAPALSAAQLSAMTPDGVRSIEVNLSTQTLTAWQGNVVVLYTSISSGRPGTPTVDGRYQIGVKYTSQRMTGPGYDLPGVPWVMYFYGSYAIHGTYWHNNFGTPMSRGCVNTTIADAEFLYNWAPEGTEVWVHY